MDVSAEAADLVVKEGLQATETAVKLAGSGIKNVAALLLALSKQDYKVIGQASAARLAATQILPQSFRSVRRTSRASGRWRQSSTVCCICRSASAGTTAALLPSFRRRPMPQISTVLWKSWATPCPVKEADEPKKAVPLAPSEKASNERGSISTASQERTTDDVRSSVLGKLEAMRQLSAERNTDRMKVKEHIR